MGWAGLDLGSEKELGLDVVQHVQQESQLSILTAGPRPSEGFCPVLTEAVSPALSLPGPRNDPSTTKSLILRTCLYMSCA